MADWHRVCHVNEIDEEDVIEFEHVDKIYCVYNIASGFFATDGLCTHEAQSLADGIVIDNVIECPLHQGRFNITNGKALSAPVCVDLKSYETKIIDNQVYIAI